MKPEDLGEPPTPDELAAAEERIGAWLARQLDENPVMVAVDCDPEERRWYVRLAGEDKDFTTVWLTLRQRALHAETYVMPAPEEDEAAFYLHLLKRNLGMVGMRFAVGAEDAVYLMGEIAVSAVDDAQLDRLIGSTWVYVERAFRPALQIGFASRLRGR